MKALEAWLIIVEKTKNQNIEVLTEKRLRDIQRWFAVTSNGVMLMISEAPFKTPKVQLQEPILINRAEFEMIFPFYFKQERVNRMSGAWLYQDYIYAIIKRFCFTNDPELNMMLNDDESEKDNTNSNRGPEGFEYSPRGR